MKRLCSILLVASLLAGCGVTKVVTVPVKAAGTAVKYTGKATVGAVKLAVPNGDEEPEAATE